MIIMFVIIVTFKSNKEQTMYGLINIRVHLHFTWNIKFPEYYFGT